MQGDDRVRHCAQCNLDVYNFAAMSDLEVERLIANHEGRLCARMFRRSDGTVLTQNCPVGFRAQVRKVSRIAGAALSAAISVAFASAQEPLTHHLSPQAQQAKSVLSVHVSDESGAVIPHATILLRDNETGKEFTGITNPKGDFLLDGLQAGNYRMKISAQGFIPTIYEGLILHADEAPKVDIKLRFGREVLVGEVIVAPTVLAVPTDLSDVPNKITPTDFSSSPATKQAR